MRDRLERILDSLKDDALVPDGLEEAIVGYTVGQQLPGILVVDMDRATEILVAQGEDLEAAMEWLDYNTLGAYAGPGTPIYMQPLGDDDEPQGPAEEDTP